MFFQCKPDASIEEMAKYLYIADQTIACDNCGSADWGDNIGTPEQPHCWHADGCPLKNRDDVANAAMFDS